MKQHFTIKLSLFLNYFVFAILLNSVGIVILKAQNVYGVGRSAGQHPGIIQRFTHCDSILSHSFFSTQDRV